MGKTPRSIVVILLIFLAAPLLASLLRGKAENNDENRRLSPKPAFSLLGFASQDYRTAWEAYYRDNFGLRSLLVRGNFLVHYRLLKDSPTNKVIIGKDGWLFYTGDGELNDYRGITQYSEHQLKAWVKMLELKRNWLKKRGIEYIYVIAPNKSTIYPEYMPNNYTRVNRQSGLDQFFDYVKKESTVHVLDLRPVLLREKKTVLIYSKTDTHWNTYGAFVAYQALMHEVTQVVPHTSPRHLSEYLVTRKEEDGGDLAKMMGGGAVLKEESYFFKPLEKAHSKKLNGSEKEMTIVSTNKNLPRAVIFRDSFFNAMLPFVSEHFSKSIYVWEHWGSETPITSLMDKYQPQIVIEQAVERYVDTDHTLFHDKIPSYLLR